jgi:hypothetical protein
MVTLHRCECLHPHQSCSDIVGPSSSSSDNAGAHFGRAATHQVHTDMCGEVSAHRADCGTRLAAADTAHGEPPPHCPHPRSCLLASWRADSWQLPSLSLCWFKESFTLSALIVSAAIHQWPPPLAVLPLSTPAAPAAALLLQVRMEELGAAPLLNDGLVGGNCACRRAVGDKQVGGSLSCWQAVLSEGVAPTVVAHSCCCYSLAETIPCPSVPSTLLPLAHVLHMASPLWLQNLQPQWARPCAMQTVAN